MYNNIVRKIDQIENEEMMEQLNQIAKFVKEEIRYREKTQLDDYVKELLK